MELFSQLKIALGIDPSLKKVAKPKGCNQKSEPKLRTSMPTGVSRRRSKVS